MKENIYFIPVVELPTIKNDKTEDYNELVKMNYSQACGVSRFFNLTTHRFLDSPLTSHRFSRD